MHPSQLCSQGSEGVRIGQLLPSTTCCCLASVPQILHPAWLPLTCAWLSGFSPFPTFLQPHLLSLPCLLASSETRTHRPWQMCGAGEALCESRCDFVYVSRERELGTVAAGGGVARLQPPPPNSPPPSILFQLVYPALAISEAYTASSIASG